MALPTGGYSFTPREVNLGASPLSALKPINIGEGLSVSFSPMPKYEVPSAKEELVSVGAAKAFETIGTEAANAVKAKEAKRLADKEKDEERDFQARQKGLDRSNALSIAQLNAENLRNEILRKRLDADSVESINYGTLEYNLPVQTPPQNEPSLWDMGMVDNTTAYSTQPSPELLNSLLNIPPSQLMASSNTAGQGQLEGLTAIGTGTIAPPAESISTDTVQTTTPPPEPKYGAMAKYRGIYSPEETKAIRDEFYKNYGESPSAFSIQMDKPLANAPKIIPRATAPQAQQPQDGLARYMQTWADPSVAAKAADKVAELMGSGFAYPEVEQVKNKRGEVGYKVKYPKKKSDTELANEVKAKKEIEKEGKKEKLQQFQLQSFENVNRAQATLRDLEKQLEKVQSKMGPISGQLMKANPYDTDVQLLQNYLTALIPTIARGVYGEVGVLTQADIDNYSKLIPNITQSPELAKSTLEFLSKDIERAKQNKFDIWDSTNFDVEGLRKFVKIQPSQQEDLQNKINSKISEFNSLKDGPEKEKAKQELLEIRKQIQNLSK